MFGQERDPSAERPTDQHQTSFEGNPRQGLPLHPGGESPRELTADEAWGLAALVDSADDAIIGLDLHGRITSWNPAAERIYGHAAVEAIGRSIAILGPTNRGDEIRQILDRVRRGEVIRQVEILCRRQDGREIHVGLTVSPIRDATGQVVGASAIARDITPLAPMGAALRETGRFLDQVLDSLYAFVGLISPDGTLLRANWAALRAAALTPDDVLGRPFVETYWWSHARPVQDRLRAAIARGARGEASRYDEVVRLGPDRFITIDFQLVPIVDEDGRVTFLVPSAIDITEHKEAERRLRENEERLRAIVDTAVDGIITIDDRGTILSFNAAAERMFGYPACEVLGREVSLLMPSPYRERHAAHLAKYRETGVGWVIGTVLEVAARRKDGSVFPIELSVSEVHELGLFTGILRDISERKLLRQQLLTIAEEQQRRIGQDLHDDVGQELTGVALMADALAEALEDAASAEAGLGTKIRDCLQRVQKHVRALARGLIPVEVDARGLMAALNELTAGISELHGIECSFECHKPVPIEDSRVATQLYRITQEAIANALQHSRTQRMTVTLEERDGIITLEVRDHGIGLPSGPEHSAGVGLRIMRYRAELIGGMLEVGSAEGGGTRVICTIGGGHEDVRQSRGQK